MLGNFDPVETTIGDAHEAMRGGDLTSAGLVEAYLDRIDAYDRAGPELNSVVTVAADARARAAELDRRLAADGPVGPLHGIPVLVKDQALTAGTRTTFGSEAFAEYVPDRDATVVERLRDAGAVVLAKTNMPDWAAGFVGYSSVAGQTRNPYDPARDPGGSSAGTGAGVAANLGTVGVGEDTGGSIRVPASCCNLFGLRVTTGLVSRHGLSPLVERQDTAGPMARTVEDLTRLLDVLVGYDPADARSAVASLPVVPESYRQFADEGGLEGKRLGVLRAAFGPDDDPVTSVVEDALATMAAAGADLVDPVTLPDLEGFLSRTSLYEYQAKRDIDGFLAGLTDPPVGSLADVFASGRYHDRLALLETISDAPADPTDDPAYWRAVAAQERFQQALVGLQAEHDLDGIAFPDVAAVPRRHEALRSGEARRADFPVNTVIASQSGCPAVSIPAGFTDGGLPVGLEVLAPPFGEPTLLSVAAGFERVADPRRPPSTAPPLGEEDP